MFIPTKSDGQIFVNLRKNKEKKKYIFFLPLRNHFPRLCHSFLFLLFGFCFCFFFMWDAHVPLLHFLVRFSPETIYFIPVSILFILIEYSLNICHFSRFFKNLVFRFHSTLVRLEIRKIFRLSRNSTKFFRVTRFRETNLTAQSVLSSEI